MSIFNSLYADYQVLIKDYPMFAGSIPLYLLGCVTYLARNAPKAIWNFFVDQATVTINFNNVDAYDNKVFNNFLAWYQSSRWFKFSRSLRASRRKQNRNWDDDEHTMFGERMVTIGLGRHFFFYEGSLYWVRFRLLETKGISWSSRVQNEVDITTLGRSHARIEKLLKNFAPKQKDETLTAYTFSKDEWVTQNHVPKRDPSTVITRDNLLENLANLIQKFTERREWYIKRGLPYKLVILLRGEPGTGKTSIIRALASLFNRDIHAINLNTMNDITLSAAINSVPFGRFVVMEDIHSVSALLKDGKGHTVYRTDKSGQDQEDNDKSAAVELLSLSGVLNVLDGVIPLDGQIIFMTTNYADRIEPALLRAGRTDIELEVKALSHKEICRYISLVYEEPFHGLDGKIFKEMVGAELQELYINLADDREELLRRLPFETIPVHVTTGSTVRNIRR